MKKSLHWDDYEELSYLFEEEPDFLHKKALQKIVLLLVQEVGLRRYFKKINKDIHHKDFSMQDEILDLVDRDDNVIGKELRSIVYKNKMNNFRVINALLINSKGEVWIPVRSSQKKIFPNCLDVSVGGHVESGEDYLEAFKRELQEELNLDLDTLEYSEIGYLSPHKNGVSAFMKVYLIQNDVTPLYNQEEFFSAQWYSITELISLLETGTPAKSDLIKIIKYYNDYIRS